MQNGNSKENNDLFNKKRAVMAQKVIKKTYKKLYQEQNNKDQTLTALKGKCNHREQVTRHRL